MKGVLNTRGQATIEAVLMLVLGVSMVLGLMAGFNKQFERFTELYFGEYFACLIENGQLPYLQYETKDECGKILVSFSSLSGKDKDNSTNNNSKGSSSSSKEGSKKSGSLAGRIRPTQGINESGLSKNANRFSVKRGGSSGSAATKNGGGEKKANDAEGGGYGGQQVGTYGKLSGGNDGGVQIIKIKRRAKGKDRGSSYGLYKDPGDKKNASKIAVKKPEQGNANKASTRLKIERTIAKVKEKKEEKFSLNFSSIMRFLIIAALIIIIIIVIGGQLLSISKSFE
ncbi:MAG: hypothetical protein HAW63_03095 [Bdellovibrionaceae bacterium]|nr:hypothetical protein [Pseudobdellovibrionaceae bacterium]